MVKQLISSASITLQDLSDAIISGTQPTNPKLDQLWIKRTDGKPDELYRWNGTAWVDQTLDLNKLDPDADGKIEKHDITIGNMVNDSVIDITERQEVKNKISPLIGRAVVDTDGSIPSAAQLWAAGVGEVWAVRKAAQNVGIKNTDAIYLAVETAYNALQAYLNSTSPIRPWDASAANKDKVITVVPTEWRNKWIDYYKAVQNLTTEVQAKLQGNIEGIIIGGENLIDGTSFDDAVSWYSWANLGRVGVYDVSVAGKSLYVETKDKTTGNQLDVPINTPVGLQSGADKSIKVLKDQEYTVSANIATSELGNTLDYTYILHTNSADNMKINTLTVTSFPQIKPVYSGATTYYHYVTFTFKAKMDDDIRILIGGRTTRELKPSAGVTGYAWIRINELKVEKGNKATAWKPSQKDINKLISDADDKAQKVTDSVNDMSIDSKLTPVEKIQLKTDYESITAEFTTTLNSADAFNLTSSSERVAYNAAYNSLKTFVDPLLLKMAETSAVDRNTFRQRFKDYYDTKAKLLKKISDTSKGLIDSTGQSNGNILRNAMWADGEKFWTKSTNTTNHTLELLDNAYLKQKVYRQTVVNETADKWHAIFSDYFPASPNQTFTFSIYANTPDTTKLDYPAWMIAEWFDSAGTRLLRGSVSLTASGNNRWERFSFTTTVPEGAVKGRLRAHLTRNGQIYYAKPMVQLGSYLGEWGVSHLDFNLQEIEKTTEESKNNIANMSNDSKLTPIEKVQLKKEWAVIYAEKPQYESLGVSFKATTEVNAYINAYNVLNSTLNNSTNGYLKNMQSTEDINGAAFRAQFDDYYDKKSVLIKKVNQIIQGNIDGIQSTRNIVLNSKRTITNSDYQISEYMLSEDWVEGQDYTIVIKGSLPSGQQWGIYAFDGNHNLVNINPANTSSQFSNGVYYATFKGRKKNSGTERALKIYNLTSAGIAGRSATIEWVSIYKGTKPFDWSPAPEDADVGKTNLFIDSEFKYLSSWNTQDVSKQKITTGVMPNGVRHFEANVSVSPAYVDFTQYIEVEPNTEYTFSMNAGGSFRTYFIEQKADKTNTAIYKDNVLVQNGIAFDMSSPRNTFTRTFKTQHDTKILKFIFRVQALDAGQTGGRFALPKLEKGTTASEWTANPFDTSNGEIFIQGSGADQTDKSRQLVVNGVPVYNESTGRGLRLVTLRKDSLAVVDNILYDVYGSDVERNNLATKLNSLGNNVFITLSSYDAIQFNTNLLTAIVSIGGSGTILTGRVPYVLIGMKGLGRYNGLEQYTGSGNLFAPATISCKVVNGMIQGVNNNNGQSDANVRKDLRLNAPLPTSILLNEHGITASGTDSSKYARLDYRGLYIAGGAIQIDGGLPEGQLSQGVTNKFTYIDKDGVYTGKVTANQIVANTIKTQQLDVNEIFGNTAVINKIAAVDISGDRVTAGTIKAKNGGFNIDVNRGEIWFNAPNQTKPITSFVQAKAGITDITYWVVEANNNPNAMLALGVRASDGSIANYLQIDSNSGKLNLLSNEVRFLSSAFFNSKAFGATWVLDPIGGARGYAAFIPYTPNTGSLGLGNYRWEELNANWVNYAELNKFSTRKSKKDIKLASHEIAEKIVREVDIYNYIYNHSESIDDNIQTGWIFEEVMKHEYAHLIANPTKEGMKADVIPAINWLVIQTLLKRMDEKDEQLNILQQQIDK